MGHPDTLPPTAASSQMPERLPQIQTHLYAIRKLRRMLNKGLRYGVTHLYMFIGVR